MYFYWGYNRSFYTKSDLHFQGPDYDFTLGQVVAKDRPTSFSLHYFAPQFLSVPQYVYRAGYYVSDRFCVSLGSDHMKYVMQADQSVAVSGVVSNTASAKYGGSYSGQQMVVAEDFLTFEHSDGLNLLTVDAEYLVPLFSLGREKIKANWNVGAGGVFMITKTRVFVFGVGQDNAFHLSGLTAHAKTGPRVDFFNRFFIGFETKAGYAVLPWVLLNGKSQPQRADHKLGYLEYYGVAGVYFKFKESNKRSVLEPSFELSTLNF